MRIRLQYILLAFTILLTGYGQLAFSQISPPHFANYGIKNGLSASIVNCVLKDSYGFLWVGTNNGLNRFDGYNTKVFENDPTTATSLVGNRILSLAEDNSKNLWVGTTNGICIKKSGQPGFERINLANGKTNPLSINAILATKTDNVFIGTDSGFFVFNNGTKQHFALESMHSTNIVNTFTEDQQGMIWIGSSVNKLFRFDPTTQQLNSFDLPLNYSEKYNYGIHYLFADINQMLWVGTEAGLMAFNLKTKKWETKWNQLFNQKIGPFLINGIQQDKDGFIWIVTDGAGLFSVNPKTKELQNFRYQSYKNSLSTNGLYCLLIDPQNIFWIGTYKNGVDYFKKSSKHFHLLRHDPQDKTSLSKSDVNFLAEDHNHHIWIGTNGAGIDVLNQNKKVVKRLTSHDKSGLSNDVVVSIYEDHQGIIWIGTYYGGLNRYNPQTGTMKVFRHSANNPGSIPDDRVWSITEDRHNQLWIATLSGGLSRYQPKTEKFITYNTSNSNICGNQIRLLYKDHQNNLWACSPNGISRYNENTDNFTAFRKGITKDGERPFGEVNDLFQDSRGWFWISSNIGLIQFNPQNQQAIFLTRKEGLQSNNIKQILEDGHGNLWISSNRGISKLWFSPSDNPNELKPHFLHFDETDGLQGQEFSELAALKTSEGDLLFAGNNGLNWFNPDEIQIDTVKPNLQFTGLRIFNKQVNAGQTIDKRILLQKPIYQTNELELKYAENFFSIEFSALTYLFPEKNKYRYKLEGFDNKWYQTDGTANFATFTNLNNGDYTFLVEGSNADGVWNKKPIALKITVLPPFWKSWYAMAMYALILMGILAVLRYLVLMKERMNVRVETERREAQRIHELDTLKLKFFTNISHEFRTPLTLILSPVEKLLSKVENGTDERQLKLIHQNARRLLNMINQILDFRKMEMQGLSFQPSHGDLVHFMQDLVGSFHELSENKNIDLRLVTDLKELNIEFDRDKMEKIMFNLLSNAFKFTPNNGLVIVQIELQNESSTDQQLMIRVKDNGIGIEQEQAEKIFDRFYQSGNSQQVAEKGTGIGLSLVREYVQLHGGTIQLESAPGVGSNFTITMPVLLEEHHEEIKKEETVSQIEGKPAFSVENNFESIPDNGEKPTILLTEDNDDLRTYLKDQLAEKYQILEAINGKEGLASLQKNMPDLVISDLMMPIMDGIEFCKQAKGDPITCHIPFIMLTAKTSEQQQLQGLQTGADDYLTKPFNLQILEAKVNNLVQLKMNIRRSFKTKLQLEPQDISINSLDEQFMKKILDTMEENMGNNEFTVEEFSRIMGVSRMQLYKKLVSLTGKPPVEFIRIMRLKRAAQLLKKSQLNVSEVAYQVGFNDPKYFSKQFKTEFKVLPSKYSHSV